MKLKSILLKFQIEWNTEGLVFGAVIDPKERVGVLGFGYLYLSVDARPTDDDAF